MKTKEDGLKGEINRELRGELTFPMDNFSHKFKLGVGRIGLKISQLVFHQFPFFTARRRLYFNREVDKKRKDVRLPLSGN